MIGKINCRSVVSCDVLLILNVGGTLLKIKYAWSLDWVWSERKMAGVERANSCELFLK